MIFHIVGARPNFMKLAPVWLALAELGAVQRIIHTGQHYDRAMSGSFFETLGLPEPDFNLGIGSGSHAEQTGKVMIALEKLFEEQRPRALTVYGDVNSTLAGTLVAAKMGIAVIHVEAGLRSGDMSMPEEVNRLVTDRLSSLLLTHSRSADRILESEGVPADRIVFIGNVMIDSLKRMLPRDGEALAGADLALPDRFGLVTLHRPSNVDDREGLAKIVEAINELAELIPVVFPIHPRTHARLDDPIVPQFADDVLLLEPLEYSSFITLEKLATLVVTDSGGVQEETTWLGTPCLTLRANTERPVTIEIGTNTLLGTDPANIVPAARQVLDGNYKTGAAPEGWDGCAGPRAARAIIDFLDK